MVHLNLIRATKSCLPLAQMGHLLSKLNDIPDFLQFWPIRRPTKAGFSIWCSLSELDFWGGSKVSRPVWQEEWDSQKPPKMALCHLVTGSLIM